MSVPCHIKCNVDALRRRNLRIHFVFQPVVRDLFLDDLNVPAILRAKVAAAPGNAESPFGPASGETAIRSADRTTFAEGNLVRLLLGSRPRLLLRHGRS